MKQETITIQQLQKSYGTKMVTDGVTLSLYSGEIVALVGHNGAGKTTLLNQVNGLLSSDSGTVCIQGIDVTHHPHKARELVASMPQFQVPIKGVTVKEAISCIGAMKGMAKTVITSRVKTLLADLAIEKWQDTPGEKLSGGLQRLTSFAMAVVDEPAIVLLDEPTNDVDPFRRRLMWKYLRRLANRGATVVIVTHNLSEVEQYADRYVMMEKGKLIKDVTLSGGRPDRHRWHRVTLSVLDEEILDQLSSYTNSRYDDLEKRLTLIVDEGYLTALLPIIISGLKGGQLLSYEMTLKNLSDDYEEYIHGQEDKTTL